MQKALLKITLVTGFILVGCGGGNSTASSGASGTTSGTSTTSGSSSQNLRPVSLSYADWGDPVFNQKMIDAFEARYPHITVELRQDIIGDGATFTGNLVLAAGAGRRSLRGTLLSR